MTKAEELLGNLANSHLTNPGLEPHFIIDTARYIHVPKVLQRIAVQHDHQVETVTFDCPRYWDGIDMSKMYIYVNFMRPDKVRGRYLCKNVQVDPEDDNLMHFTWTIEQDATLAKGKLRFLVCIMKTGTDGALVNHWNSELNDELFVSEGLECEDLPEEFYPEIITDLLTRMDHILLANDPLVMDTSLTEAGLAADAKATGDRFGDVEKDISELQAYGDSYQSYVTPQMIGAVGDGSTDVTSYMQTLANDSNIVDLKGRSYVITSTLTLNTIFRNGTIIYKGPTNTPVITMRNGGGLENIKIVMQTADYASSIILADYTVYSEQYIPMRWKIDGLLIDNTITSKFVAGSSCIKIAYDKYKVIYGQNINDLVFDGHIDYGIYIEPVLRDENDNPVFNTATFSKIFFFSANCALKVLPVMASGNLANARGGVGLLLNNFANQHVDGITKPFMDIHNTIIVGTMVIPWDYYGTNVPADGTYVCYNSDVALDFDYFPSKEHPSSVKFSWSKTSNNETYSNINHIITDDKKDDIPTRDNGTNWGRSNIKMISFTPQNNNPYGVKYFGFEFQRNNADDPTGDNTVQFGVSESGYFVYRMYNANTKTWTDCKPVYAAGTMPQSWSGKRPDGFGVGDMKFDTTIKKPVWWNGSAWVTADGAAI